MADGTHREYTITEAITLLNTAATSGLRNKIKMSDYHFAATTSTQDFAEFVRAVGASGHTSLNLNIFLNTYSHITYPDLIEFANIASKN